MAQRIDIAYRVIAGVNDTFDVDYNGAGALTCTVSPGLYMSSKALASAVQTAIDDQWSASASFEANANSDGTISIDSTSASFDLTWDAVSLRNWLGFSGNLSGSSLYTGSLQPGVLIESLPWVEDAHGWLWALKGINQQHKVHISKVSRRDLWSVRIFETIDNIAQVRSVMGHLLRGTPATWYRSATLTAWSYSNWHGKLEVCIDPRRTSYDEAFENPNNLQHTFSFDVHMVAI
jgi:hypothetical protein